MSAGKTTLFERPDLGQWLSPARLHEWDVIVFSKIDRAFRSTRDCVEFAKFIESHRKILAFSGDGIVLNYRDGGSSSFESQMAEFFIYIGSFFAQIELNRFKSPDESATDDRPGVAWCRSVRVSDGAASLRQG